MDWNALVRAEFPAAARLIYLGRENTLFLCRRATEEAQRYYAEAAALPGQAHWSAEVERVRERCADVVGARPEEVRFCGDASTVAARLAPHVGAAVRCVDASGTFGLEPLDARSGDVTIVTAHGVTIVHVPHGLLDVPAQTIIESTAPNYAAILAIGGALDVLVEVGTDAAAARVRDLARRLRAGLAAHAIEIAAEPGRLTMVHTRRPSEVAAHLREVGIDGSIAPDGIGLSPHLFTRDEDVDRAVQVVAAIVRGGRAAPAPASGGPLVCVDLNGVLDAYQGWRGIEHWDAPAPGAREFLDALCQRRCRVVLFTTRYYRDAWRWLEAHGLAGFISEVTDRKPAADVFVDDHAVSFRGDYDDVLRQVEQFTPHWAAPGKKASYET